MKINNKSKYQLASSIFIIAILAILGVRILFSTHALTPIGQSNTQASTPTFNYGFDFSDQEPDQPSQDVQALLNIPASVNSAISVLGNFSGSYMDQSIWGFGAQKDPQDNQCTPNTVPAYSICPPVNVANSSNTDVSSIKSRLQLITNAGGTPVITLVQAPSWMYQPGNCPNGLEASYNGTIDTNINTAGVTAFSLPPCPDNYQAFASLSAYIAQSFPQVKYFVVWSEVRDFYNSASGAYDAPSYTQMYNDVYAAIKKVRPDALVGGPYASLEAKPCPSAPTNCSSLSALNGTYGYVDQNMMNVLDYWLKNKVGADFIAVDGGTEIAKANNGNGDSTITDPVTSSEKYTYVDKWIESQAGFNNLPIWWMESHIQPNSGWTDQQAAAARIATLVLMNASGVSVGMQWQPQEQSGWPDQGLWTSTEVAGGGQATVLGNELPSLLPQIRLPLSLVGGQPTGVLVATNSNNVILINTNSTTSTAVYSGKSISLTGGQVINQPISFYNPASPPPGGSSTTQPTPSSSNNGKQDTSNSSIGSLSTLKSGGAVIYNPSNIAGLSYQNSPQSATFNFNTKNVVKVEYFLNSRLLASLNKSPFIYKLDKTHILNGSYTYKVIVYYSDGEKKIASTKLQINNGIGLMQVGLFVKAYDSQLVISVCLLAIAVMFIIKNRLLQKLLYTFPHHAAPEVSQQIAPEPTLIQPTENIVMPVKDKDNNTPTIVL